VGGGGDTLRGGLGAHLRVAARRRKIEKGGTGKNNRYPIKRDVEREIQLTAWEREKRERESESNRERAIERK
jgi:hypothetical protein